MLHEGERERETEKRDRVAALNDEQKVGAQEGIERDGIDFAECECKRNRVRSFRMIASRRFARYTWSISAPRERFPRCLSRRNERRVHPGGGGGARSRTEPGSPSSRGTSGRDADETGETNVGKQTR